MFAGPPSGGWRPRVGECWSDWQRPWLLLLLTHPRVTLSGSHLSLRGVQCWQQARPHRLWRIPMGSRTTRASFVGPLPASPPISSVVKRPIPVDQGTHQRLRLMNLNADKPENLYKGGSWECSGNAILTPRVVPIASRRRLVWWATPPFFGSDSPFAALVVVLHGNYCCHTSGVLTKWLPKPRGLHGVLLSPRILPRTWRNTGRSALALGLVAEALSAVAEFLGVLPGLLQKLALLLMLCGGGADLGYFLVYWGTDISSAVCLDQKWLNRKWRVNQNPAEFLRVTSQPRACFFLGILFKMESSSLLRDQNP